VRQTVASTTPTETLCVRGISAYATEEAINSVFRQYAPVKSVVIPRDTNSRVNRGFAFVEFFSVEHAAYALQTAESTKLQMEQGSVLRVVFAKPSFVAAQLAVASASLPALSSQHLPPPSVSQQAAKSMAAAALQAAQWQQTVPPTTALSHHQVPMYGMVQTPGIKQKPQFPPNFETNGASYVFQAQSGYFYEPQSEYYYCPKSKLYYCTAEGIYYRYEETVYPPFRRIDPPPPATMSTTDEAAAATGADDGKTAAELAKKPVVLSISSTSKIQAKPVVKTTMTLTHSKRVVNNLAKWNSLKDDEDDEIDAADATKVAGSTVAVGGTATSASKTPTPSESTVDSVAPTAAAAATSCVCLLCRRQFNSAEQLKRHETESKLHAENLAKLALATGTKANTDVTAPSYRDRAAERRAVQGDSIPIPGRARADSAVDSPAVLGARAVPEAPTLAERTVPVYQDAENPGNLLLRKMGWSEGKGLGKEGISKHA
jgi:RNA-binding protein 5/10